MDGHDDYYDPPTERCYPPFAPELQDLHHIAAEARDWLPRVALLRRKIARAQAVVARLRALMEEV
jgi:hypothetical protein